MICGDVENRSRVEVECVKFKLFWKWVIGE